jgi:hypothetical protein
MGFQKAVVCLSSEAVRHVLDGFNVDLRRG